MQTLPKCKEPFCYSDGICGDRRCPLHTRSRKRKASYASGRRSPSQDVPYLGVELECFAPDDGVHNVMLAQSARAHVDGSLPTYGCEFKICRPAKYAIRDAGELADRLFRVGAKVNRRCGLHVHLDMRRVSRDRINKALEWLATWQEWFFKLMPPSRRSSDFIKRIDPYNHTNHHTWANHTCFNTLEIRLHGGTLNPHKIRAWLTAMNDLASLIRSDKEFPVIVGGEPTEMQLKEIFPDAGGREYLKVRWAKDGILADARLLGGHAIGQESESE